MESVDYPKWQPLSLHEVCMRHIRLVLGLCQGNRTQAARILGVGRTTLYRYLQEKQNVNGTSSAPREVGPSTGPLSASRQSATEALPGNGSGRKSGFSPLGTSAQASPVVCAAMRSRTCSNVADKDEVSVTDFDCDTRL